MLLLPTLALAMKFSAHEHCPLMRCAMRLAEQRPGLVLDVGANGGCETHMALTMGRRVVAVECLASAYAELLAEPKLRTHRNLTLLHACAGESVNVSKLHLASDSSSLDAQNVATSQEAAKAAKEWQARGTRDESVVVVPGDLLLPPEARVALVKVDVQGTEYSVLAGLRGTLKQHQPVVTFEHARNLAGYKNRWSQERGNATRDILEPLGYRCYIDFVDYVCLPRDHALLQRGAGRAAKGAFPCNKDRKGLYT